MAEDCAKLKDTMTQSNVQALPLLAREAMVSYKHLPNLTELPVGSTHTVTAIGHLEHYAHQKIVVQLDDGVIYQAGDDLEEQKEQVTSGCKILIIKTRVNNSTNRKYVKLYSRVIGLVC